MSRKREWIKFGSLVGITLALAVAFISVVDLPKRSLAQQPTSQRIENRPAPIAAAQPVVDLGNAFTAVAEAVRPSVVYIASERRVEARSQRQPQLPAPFDRFFGQPGEQITPQPRAGSGSGFLISQDGYIITNNHVVEGFDRLSVQLFDKRRFDATVVGRDPDTDVAVIKIDASGLPAASLGDSDSLRVGEWVLAIGNPLGDQFSFTVTAGIVSGRGRGLRGLQRSQWSIGDFIQTDAAINPGNSGGPLVNIRGQVVGVNAAIASETGLYSGYSFAIPMNLVRTVADQLIKDGKVTRAALGVTVQEADDEDAEYVGMTDVRGVLVQGFASEDSPSKRAGMEVGDVIVDIDGNPVNYVAQLQQIVGFKRPGQQVNVTVMRRGGVKKTLQVRLIEANEEPTEVAQADTPDASAAPDYQGKLGLGLQDMTAQFASQDERLTDDTRGPIISDIDPNGPARDEGFVPVTPQRGWVDVITHVDGQRVRNVSELERALADVRPGAILSLQVFQIRADQAASRVVRMRAGGK
jgi:serine protease Do